MRQSEAENRAAHTEDEAKKLEVFLGQLKEERDILRKMAEARRKTVASAAASASPVAT